MGLRSSKLRHNQQPCKKNTHRGALQCRQVGVGQVEAGEVREVKTIEEASQVQGIQELGASWINAQRIEQEVQSAEIQAVQWVLQQNPLHHTGIRNSRESGS